MAIKYILAFIIAFHGLIHFMGFAKAFSYGNMVQLTKHISKPIGVLWFATGLMFVVAMILFLLKNENWASITRFLNRIQHKKQWEWLVYFCSQR